MFGCRNKAREMKSKKERCSDYEKNKDVEVKRWKEKKTS